MILLTTHALATGRGISIPSNECRKRKAKALLAITRIQEVLNLSDQELLDVVQRIMQITPINAQQQNFPSGEV